MLCATQNRTRCPDKVAVTCKEKSNRVVLVNDNHTMGTTEDSRRVAVALCVIPRECLDGALVLGSSSCMIAGGEIDAAPAPLAEERAWIISMQRPQLGPNHTRFCLPSFTNN